MAQEILTFVAENDTVAFSDSWYTDRNELVIHAGETVITNAEVTFGTVHIGSELHLIIRFSEPNRYWAFAKYFRPAHTEDVFGEDIFIEHPKDRYDPTIPSTSGFYTAIGDVGAMWVPCYYADILRGQNRYRLIEMHPWLGNLGDDNIMLWGRELMWYENSEANIRHGRTMFYNSVIDLGGVHFAVRNIVKTDFGYIVDCVISTFARIFTSEFRHFSIFPESAFWVSYQAGDAVTLFLHIDGDYLDIFTYGSDIHVGTFIRVGREFIAQYQSLIRTNTADLTNVVWPQRAEGSTGIPPTFVLPDGFRQEIVEYNTENNAENNAENLDEAADQENVIVQRSSDINPMPIWVWIVISGGVVAVVCVAVLVARRKR